MHSKYWHSIYFIPSYDIEITDEIVGRAPIPELIVGVKQDGNPIFWLSLLIFTYTHSLSHEMSMSFLIFFLLLYFNTYNSHTGTLIDEELTVKPGTPLNMEIYLDRISADIYGLMVSNLDVTDTIQSQESLIVNG